MGKILEAIANDKLYAAPITEKRNPEHQRAADTAYTLLEQLAEKLNIEENEMLDKAVDALHDENIHYNTNRFVRGYCLGALMMLEILEQQDEFFYKQEP